MFFVESSEYLRRHPGIYMPRSHCQRKLFLSNGGSWEKLRVLVLSIVIYNHSHIISSYHTHNQPQIQLDSFLTFELPYSNGEGFFSK